MADDVLARLGSAKARADAESAVRRQYAAYVADRREHGGWSEADVAEYKAAVGQIMQSGTEEEKAAAREFWALKAAPDAAAGINQRMREAA